MITDYTSAMPKFVIISGNAEQIAHDFCNARSLRFIGNGDAILTQDDYNDVIAEQAAESMIDRYQEELAYGDYEPY
jgi:hypothetical protein